jgi:hypothetical protein
MPHYLVKALLEVALRLKQVVTKVFTGCVPKVT